MSTNNRWQKLAVKSDPRETRLKSRSTVLAKTDNEVSDSAVQQVGGRGRPRSADKGQVVSCRLPADAVKKFITEQKPTYPQFEAWVKAQPGVNLTKANIHKSNLAIAGYVHTDEVRSGSSTPAPTQACTPSSTSTRPT